MTVTLVEAMPRLLPAFDPVIGESVLAHLAKHEVKVVLGLSAAEVSKDGVRLTDGCVIGADLVLAAIGIRPRVDLAAAAGVKIGETGQSQSMRRCSPIHRSLCRRGLCGGPPYRVAQGGVVRWAISRSVRPSWWHQYRRRSGQLSRCPRHGDLQGVRSGGRTHWAES